MIQQSWAPLSMRKQLEIFCLYMHMGVILAYLNSQRRIHLPQSTVSGLYRPAKGQAGYV